MIQHKTQPRIEDVLFRIEERPLFVAGTPGLAGGSGHVRVDGYRAIVDVERGRVLSVVSDQYRLVENSEALALGRACFEQVFKRSADTMSLFNIVQPTTRSFCHVDYLEQVPPTAKAAEWRPFLRITNSYNRTFPLRFDVGSCRGMCTNGMIFGKRSIEFRYPHTSREIKRTAVFRSSFTSIDALQSEFDGWMAVLKSMPIERAHVPAIVSQALGMPLEPERWQSSAGARKLSQFAAHLDQLDHDYSEELGRNGYGVFNVITDLATRPVAALASPASVNRLQRRASEWVEGTVEKARKGESSVPENLEQSKALRAFAGFFE